MTKDMNPITEPTRGTLKCFRSELKEVKNLSMEELFSGFDEIKAVTFSYDLSFVNKIMGHFSYGDFILGADFLVQRQADINEFLAELFANSYEASKMLRKYPQLTEGMKEETLSFRTPKFIMDHRKIYLLKADDGRTRVITGSANLSRPAWDGSHQELYEYDDSLYCYEEYLKDFQKAWENSQEIPMSVVVSKKAEDLVDGNAILNGVEKTGRTIVLKQPETESNPEIVKFTIDHDRIKEEYKKIIKASDTKKKKGLIEIIPRTIEKIRVNQRKVKKKNEKITERTESYPTFSFDYDEGQAFLNKEALDLHPSKDEIRKDIDLFLQMFSNFDNFVGDTEKLKKAHFKMINTIFASPFSAKLRCAMYLIGREGITSLPLILLVASKTANCGKTFSINFALKMMTGKKLNTFKANEINVERLREIQVGCKGVPLFVDEINNRYFANIKEFIKNSPGTCESNQLEEMPMLIFASNDVQEPDDTQRKRMVFIRLESALPSSIDQSAYRGVGNRLMREVGTAFYREYLSRMLPRIKEELDFILLSKNIPDEYYSDLMAMSSQVILQILRDNGYEIPGYMKEMTWYEDYSENAAYITDDIFKEIAVMYNRNPKNFTINNDTIEIELSLDDESKKKGKSWENVLPPEMEASYKNRRDRAWITLNRKELEKRLKFSFGGFGNKFLKRKINV